MKDEYVTEEDLDQEEIFARGGENCGDEDFMVFCCPHCRQIYLLDYEVDTAYLDSGDLRVRAPVSSATFDCVQCHRELPRDEPWIGKKARDEFRVRMSELSASGWKWILKDQR